MKLERWHRDQGDRYAEWLKADTGKPYEPLLLNTSHKGELAHYMAQPDEHLGYVPGTTGRQNACRPPLGTTRNIDRRSIPRCRHRWEGG